MDLRQLRYFVAVAEEGHVTRAARSLHVAQPTVSQGLRQLERALGVLLFERTGRGVRLTQAGRRLLPDARAALGHVERIDGMAGLFARGRTGLLRVGHIPFVYDALVGPAAKQVQAQRPQVEFDFQEVGFTSRLQALLRCEVDVALFPGPPDEPDLVSGPVVHRGRRVLAIPLGHRLATRSELGLEDLAGETLPSPGTYPTPSWAQGWFPACTPSGRPLRQGSQARTLGESLFGVATGRYVALMPEEIVAVYRRGDIVFRPIEAEPYEVVPVWRSDGDAPLVEAFVEMLCEVGDPG